MADLVSELAQQGRALEPKDRERLVDLLIGSFEESSDPAVEEAWRHEIRHRVAAYERGEAELFDAAAVMAEAAALAR